ncbi:MAG: serine/threonine-protein kinase [Planctomycetota bacterium]
MNSRDPQFWQRLRELFEATLQLPPDQRESLIALAAVESSELKSELVELLRHHDLGNAEGFLERGSAKDSSSHAVMGSVVRSLSEFAATPRIPGYEIEGLLGRGGMGVVWKAHDPALIRSVAIKQPLVLGTLDPSVKDRFLREARAAARLQHPHICPIHLVSEVDGQPYLVMPFLSGPTLRDWARQKLPSEPQAAMVVAALARAVAVAHELGIIHRDIKPSNVIMTDESRSPVLMDFGCAKDLESVDGPVSHSGLCVGTPAYMAPEQANSKLGAVDARSDVYSLGIVLYELICGRPAFEGTTAEVLNAVCTQDPAPPRSLAPYVHRDLETICLKATAKSPADRYQTAAELADDLERFIAGEFVRARRASVWERGRRHIARHRAVASLAGVAVAALVLVLALTWRAAAVSLATTLQTQLQAGLDKNGWNPSDFEDLDQLATQLYDHQPHQATFFRRRIAERIEREVRDRLRRRDFDQSTADEALQWLTILEAQIPDAAAQHRTELSRRLRAWATTVSLVPPFREMDRVFPNHRFTVNEPRSRFAMPVATGIETIVTTIPCSGHTELRMKVANCSEAPLVGARLSYRGDGGYDFLLGSVEALASLGKGDSGAGWPTMGDAMRDGRAIRLQLRRRGIVVRELQVSPEFDVQGDSVEIVARREDDQLELRLEGLRAGESGREATPPLVKYRDAFPLNPGPEDTWSLLWMAPLEMRGLVVSRQLRSPATNPRERGDDHYSKGEFQQALSFYSDAEIGDGEARADVEQELRFKRGLCLSQLQREEEALALWATVMNETGERWPVVAGCHLWENSLRHGHHAEAEAIFGIIGARYSQSDLLALISDDLRKSIIRSYQNAARGLVWFRHDPDRTRNLMRAEAVEELMGADIEQRAWTWWGVFRSAWADGQLELALSRGDKLLSVEPEVRWTSVQFFMEYCTLSRQLGNASHVLSLLNQQIAKPRLANRGPVFPLLIERARTFAALGQPDRAEADLDDYFRRVATDRERFYYFGDACLLRGFLRADRGDAEGAISAWREGALACRFKERPVRVTSEGMEIVLASMLGSLSNELDEAAADVLLTKALEGLPLGVLGPSVKQTFPLPPDILAAMWRSPHGRNLARQFALRTQSPSEFGRQGCLLIGGALVRRGAFHDAVSADQGRVIDELTADVFDAWNLKKLSELQLTQLGMAWKGQTGIFGWAAVARTLPPSIKLRLAYVLGHRLIRLNRPDEATQLLKQVRESSPPDSELSRLCQASLVTMATPAKVDPANSSSPDADTGSQTPRSWKPGPVEE